MNTEQALSLELIDYYLSLGLKTSEDVKNFKGYSFDEYEDFDFWMDEMRNMKKGDELDTPFLCQCGFDCIGVDVQVYPDWIDEEPEYGCTIKFGYCKSDEEGLYWSNDYSYGDPVYYDGFNPFDENVLEKLENKMCEELLRYMDIVKQILNNTGRS